MPTFTVTFEMVPFVFASLCLAFFTGCLGYDSKNANPVISIGLSIIIPLVVYTFFHGAISLCGG